MGQGVTPEVGRKRARLDAPVTGLLGRLAVSETVKGQGLASILLVDAKSPAAAAFYQHFGSVELPGQPGRWMLSRTHFGV